SSPATSKITTSRGRLERHLPEDVLATVRRGEKKPGVVRLMVPNRVYQRRSKKGEQGEGIDLGLPSPEALKRAFEEARQKAKEGFQQSVPD
ncbi:MAG: hypothetical protein AAFN74_07290, partial [Myxococcota bacterium]